MFIKLFKKFLCSCPFYIAEFDYQITEEEAAELSLIITNERYKTKINNK